MSNPKGMKKSDFHPKGPTTFRLWVKKLLSLLIITNMQKVSRLLFGIKLWLKDDNMLCQFKP